jgi:hypothetical protein
MVHVCNFHSPAMLLKRKVVTYNLNIIHKTKAITLCYGDPIAKQYIKKSPSSDLTTERRLIS